MGFSDKQIKFIALSTRLGQFNILSGVTGSGKSYAANLRFYAELVRAPKNSVFIASGNTFSSLYDNIIAPLMELSQADGDQLEYTKAQEGARIKCHINASEIVLIGANNERAEARIQGKPKVRIWYADEVTKQPQSFIDMALSRLRYEEDGRLVVGKAIWTCNPEGPSHPIKMQYIDSTDKDVENTYWGFYDNPLIDDDYIEQMKTRFHGVFYDRMILGKWVLGSGAIYNTFSRDKHVIKEFPSDQIIEYYIGVDWGYEHPLALLLIGVDYDGNYFVKDEIYLKHQLIDESLKKIIKDKGWLDLKWGDTITQPSYSYADSARPEYVYTFGQIMDMPCIPANKAPHSVIEGIQMIQRKLALKPNGKHSLYIMENCTNLIREFENYTWATSKDNTKDEPDKAKGGDDLLDALRYVIFTMETGRVRTIDKNPMR